MLLFLACTIFKYLTTEITIIVDIVTMMYLLLPGVLAPGSLPVLLGADHEGLLGLLLDLGLFARFRWCSSGNGGII